MLTTSLGLGSGDFLPGFDLHLNSMLGETDLLRGELEPGTRMASMMAPSIALADSGTVVVAAGAAGGTRLRSALVQVLVGVLDEGLGVADAVARRGCIPPAGLCISSLGSTPLSRRRSCRPDGRPRVARAAPLLRRRERDHADRRCGRPS